MPKISWKLAVAIVVSVVVVALLVPRLTRSVPAYSPPAEREQSASESLETDQPIAAQQLQSLLDEACSHRDEIQRRAEERPPLVHLAQHVQFAVFEPRAEGLAGSKPRGKQQPRLRPREHPGDRAQRIDPAVLRAADRAAANRHDAELHFGRRLPEVLDEPRVFVDDFPIYAARRLREPVHHGAPARIGRCRDFERGAKRRRRVELQRARGDLGQPELRLDHFSLFGDAKAAVHGSRGLRLDGEIRRPAAAADAAAASVEQRQLDPGIAAHIDD